MGWFKFFFKGSKDKGRYDRTDREDSRSETEYIDHASLSEDDQNSKNGSDSNSQLEEDEGLARALPNSLNVEYSHQHSNGNSSDGGNNSENIFPPIPFPYSTGLRICAGCNQPITEYYELCVFGNWSYHKACIQTSYSEKCDVCKNALPINYKVHPFWLQKYCHEHDGTPRCWSCDRMESYEKTYIALNDGRNLCLECLNSAIMDTDECQPLYLRVQEFFEGLNMEVKEEVPLLLVDKEGMKEALDNDHQSNTRGVCLCEEKTVLHISRGPRLGYGNQMTDIETESYELTKHCEVTGILILYGLPRLLTGQVIAHELMHAWLRLNGYRSADVDDDVEEGICQLLAHMWLLSQTIRGDYNASTPFDKRQLKFLTYEIETNTTVKYGDSFRAGLEAVRQYGLQYTLDHIWTTASFPKI